MHLIGGLFFYITGLASAPYLDWHQLFIAIPFTLAGLTFLTKNNSAYRLLFALFLVSCGFSQYFLVTETARVESRAELIFTDQPLILEGTVNALGSRPENGLFADLDSLFVYSQSRTTSVPGMVRIYIGEHDAEINPGETIKLSVKLRQPENFATPGAFNYTRYLTRRHIIATGFTRTSSNFARIQTDHGWQPIIAIKKWRNQIRKQLDTELPEQSASFIKALAIGDRGAVTGDQRDLLARSGLAHLFAISGLHLGLVAAFLYLIFRSIYRQTFLPYFEIAPRRILPPLILPILFSYMILTGSAISTLRALTIFAAMLILCCCSRRSRPIDVLAAAAFTILMFDPLTLFEPSFQLSFAGAAGIVLFLPWWKPRLETFNAVVRYPLILLAVTLSASLTTLPLVLFHFHILAPAGPLLNLAAVPLISFIVIPLILIATLLSPASLTVSTNLFKMASSILMKFLDFVEVVITYHPFQAKMVYLTPANLGFLTLILTLAAFYSRLSRPLKAASIIGVIILAIISQTGKVDDDISVTSFDVGQGEATLLQLPDTKALLIDGGGLYSKTFDVGERLVAPALGRLNINKLNAVVLSHDHPDHRQGLIHILEHFAVNEFWCATPPEKLHPLLRRTLLKMKIPVRVFPTGWSDISGQEYSLQIFVPANRSDNLNDQSLVVYAGQGADGVLLTGDLENTGIRELATGKWPGPVTLLKIPHHGSRKSPPGPLLEKFKPATSFVSVGRNNRYNLPHPTTLAALDKKETPLYRTDKDGTLRFRSNGDGWAITHWKKGLFR